MLTPKEILSAMRVKLSEEQKELPVEHRIKFEELLEKAGICHDRIGTWERNLHYPGKRYMEAMMQAKQEYYSKVG